jgi:chitinase
VSTVTTYTITQCPPEVPDCPGNHVVTETIPWYTTVCPVGPTPTGVPSTTSTVYTTHVYTVTDCPPDVVDCPAHPSTITETIPWYTTVCPVSPTGGIIPPPSTFTATYTTTYTRTSSTITQTITQTYCPGCEQGSSTNVPVPPHTTPVETTNVPVPPHTTSAIETTTVAQTPSTTSRPPTAGAAKVGATGLAMVGVVMALFL